MEHHPTAAERVVRGVLLWAVAVACLTIGVAVGIPHALRTGWGVASVSGLGALVAGLAIGVRGTRRLLRGHRWWVVLPAATVLLVVTALSLFTVGQALAATVAPATVVGSATPAGSGLAYRDVQARTADGVALSGWYIPGTNGAAVILLHGSGSTRSATMEHAAVLAAHGYGVLMLDARGHGRSAGRAMDFGWYGDLDVRAAVDLVQAQPEVATGRIAALGLSMGGEEAIGAAAADPRLRAVVAEGATHRRAADRSWLSERYGVAGRLQEQLDRLTYAAAAVLSGVEQPTPLREAAGQAAPRPMLLIAGGAVPDEALAATWIRSGAPDSVTVWVVPGAGHTAGLHAQPRQWEEHVVRFLDDALAGPG